MDLLSINNIGQINIDDIEKLINKKTLHQGDINGNGGFSLDDIKIMLGAITPIPNLF